MFTIHNLNNNVFISDNPSSAFHLDAKFVNSSAVSAEMYHVTRRQRTTDALLALRLNTSTLLHSRIHWRPELINDLKVNICPEVLFIQSLYFIVNYNLQNMSMLTEMECPDRSLILNFSICKNKK